MNVTLSTFGSQLNRLCDLELTNLSTDCVTNSTTSNLDKQHFYETEMNALSSNENYLSSRNEFEDCIQMNNQVPVNLITNQICNRIDSQQMNSKKNSQMNSQVNRRMSDSINNPMINQIKCTSHDPMSNQLNIQMNNQHNLDHKRSLQRQTADEARYSDPSELNSENYFNHATDALKKEERRRSACNRERLRMKAMNQAFNNLRIKLPSHYTNRKRLSKIESLR